MKLHKKYLPVIAAALTLAVVVFGVTLGPEAIDAINSFFSAVSDATASK